MGETVPRADLVGDLRRLALLFDSRDLPFDLLTRAAREIEGYRRALSAHHELSTLSDEVIREYDFRECPVCARARKRDEGDGVAEAAPHH